MVRASSVFCAALVALGFGSTAAAVPPIPDPSLLDFVVFALEDERDAIEDTLPGATPGPYERSELVLADDAGALLLADIRDAGLAIPPSAESLLELLPTPGSGIRLPAPREYDAAIEDVVDLIVSLPADAFDFETFDAPPASLRGADADPAAETESMEQLATAEPVAEAPAPATPSVQDPIEAPASDAGNGASIEPVTDPAGDAPSSNDGSGSTFELLAMAIGLLGLAIGVIALSRGRRHDRLADIASTDGLTGLRNRRSFDLDVEACAERGDQPTATLMIDVDHFKRFNDTHGHPAGDDALRAVAAIIGRQVRKDDVAYRYGGEEFCVLLPDTDAASAAVVAERIRRAIETAELPVNAKVTASVGVAAGAAEEITGMLDRADGALYDAKDAGRNRISIA